MTERDTLEALITRLRAAYAASHDAKARLRIHRLALSFLARRDTLDKRGLHEAAE